LVGLARLRYDIRHPAIPMDPRTLIEQNVELIERVVQRACRRVGIPAGDVDDAASMVKLALVDNDYEILRRYEGRASLATYLAIVVQRMLADQRERTHGRWRPSPEAKRLGDRAVVIEDIVGRQKRSIDEALPHVRVIDASITREEVVAIADRRPQRRPRPREVELPAEEAVPLAAGDRSDAAALDSDLHDASRLAGTMVRETIAGWPAEDRLLVRLRFESALSIADISRLMNVPQRPLYRRLEALLAQLRERLLAAGIDPSTAGDLAGASGRIEMDFGFTWKNGDMHRTTDRTDGESRETQR
jgi:RNA polymerase sigma factor (sigma-70 family)